MEVCVHIEEALHRRRFSKQPPQSEVPRVVNPPEDVFRQYFVAQGSPIVIVGSRLFTEGSRTLDDILRPGAADVVVRVRGGDYLHGQREYQDMSLAEYVERHVRPFENGAHDASGTLPRYAGNSPLSHEDFQALGFRYPECFEGRAFDSPRLWFGPKGSVTPLHYDTRDNLMCQYIGTKRLMLYPPSQIPWLYTRGYAPAWSGIADPRRPDLRKFPLFARASAVEVTLRAGEVLYLPKKWAHFVVNVETSLMVNFWPEYTGAQRLTLRLRSTAGRVKRRLMA
jgi:hypothetical protein